MIRARLFLAALLILPLDGPERFYRLRLMAGTVRWFGGQHRPLALLWTLVWQLLGWSGETCNDCGRKYQMVWRAQDGLWDQLYPNGGMLCPDCLGHRADRAGVDVLFLARRIDWKKPDTYEPEWDR